MRIVDRPDNINVYILYSQQDEDLKKELIGHLSVLQRQGYIDVWHDGLIDAGEDINIQKELLQKAHIVLLLVSADFLDPECYDQYSEELRIVYEREKKGEVKIIPVILRDCPWQLDILLATLKPLPIGGQAVGSRFWESKDKAFTDIALELQRIANGLMSVARHKIAEAANNIAALLQHQPAQAAQQPPATPPPAATPFSSLNEEEQAYQLINELIGLLTHDDMERCAYYVRGLIHASLISNGVLSPEFRNNSFNPSYQRARLYKMPVEITEKKSSNRKSIGFRSSKEDGTEWSYGIAKVNEVGGMPAYIRIFFPANGSGPKISGLNL